jgi:hypothetical protein
MPCMTKIPQLRRFYRVFLNEHIRVCMYICICWTDWRFFCHVFDKTIEKADFWDRPTMDVLHVLGSKYLPTMDVLRVLEPILRSRVTTPAL